MHECGTTLVAVASPPGRGGVGCLRLSGPQSPDIARRLFAPAASSRAAAANGGPQFGRFVGRDGRFVDHGYLVVFPAGHSFTGEPTAELWPHGSPAVLAELVQAAVVHGAVPAGPGEFTYRALRSGRLDLTRAEAVRDLVEARTLYQARVAFAQAEGALSLRLAPLREALEEWIARGEAAVEFVEESETHLPAGRLARAIDESRVACRGLLAGFRQGRVVRDGASLAILGLPNAGKSSLFNRLLARERAIVSEIAGTTRDTLEEAIDLEGIPLRVIDTAGLRASADPVEGEGVQRAERARAESDFVLLVLDGARPLELLELAELERAADPGEGRRTVVAVNKCDLDVAMERDVPHPAPWRISARTGAGLAELRAELARRLRGTGPLEDPILTNARHAQALEGVAAALDRAAEAAGSSLPDELVLEDLRDARRELGTITGEFAGEELYDRIFSTFCIGK